MFDPTRRALFSQMGLSASAAAMGAGFLQSAAFAQTPEAATPEEARPGVLNVRDFGALGDGQHDDTEAFQKAIDAASAMGGNIVFVPRGDYHFTGNLRVKRDVVLEGVFRSPVTKATYKGSCLLPSAGKGEEEGTPFLTLEDNGTLSGLSIFYPGQEMPVPVPYPWTIMGDGDNIAVRNVQIVNPWQALNLTKAGRHFVDGLYAHALRRGLFVDNCFDVGRIQNVHFWPFWADDLKLHAFTTNNLEAFIIGRTDWEYMLNCFVIFAKVGFKFIKTEGGDANAVLNTCGSDVGPLAVEVESCLVHAGVSFVNSQIMASVKIGPKNRGTVKFTACGFWGLDRRGADRFGCQPTRSHMEIEGTGPVYVNACHFDGWNRTDDQSPCIHAHSGGLTVIGSEFSEKHPSIVLEKDVECAIITGNRFNVESPEIVNRMKPELCQIGLNVAAIRSGKRIEA
ncbi:MAG: hypothetical protein HYV27_12360 [Candidatus Hydrogenedentes bacterium]|nr:hypothetical protein [Candidatus Hydrogenedentota bacterium]